MNTNNDLRPGQIGAALLRFSDAGKSGQSSQSPGKFNDYGEAEIILFPKASIKALKRPRKKLTRRHIKR